MEAPKYMLARYTKRVDGNSYGLFRMAIHPSYDPDEALADQIEMIKYLKEKESYEFIKYSDLLGSESST